MRDLRTEIDTENGTVTAADGVSFDLHSDEVLAVVGESGCGKTVLALSILGLLPRRTGRITGGQVLFDGEDLTGATPERLREIRGAEIAMIFQDALTGLHPLRRVGDQIVEMIRAHERVPRAIRRRRRWTCWTLWESRRRIGAPTRSPTNSPAGCASGS